MTVQQEFLVAYNYGMGGLWAIVRAESATQIKRIYPELDIIEQRPAWMSKEDFESIRQGETHNLADEPAGVLQAILADRSR